jgi:hypothetical protein
MSSSYPAARLGNDPCEGTDSQDYGERVRLPVPGPRDLLSVLERGAASVEQLLAAVPRMVALVAEAESLVARADRLVAGIDTTRSRSDAVVARTNLVVDRSSALVDRFVPLLDATEPSLTKLQPTLERLADTTAPAEVDAMVEVVDTLPVIATRLEEDIMPMLANLNSVAPDLHDLLEVSRELNEMLAQVPGLSRMKRRIDRQQAEDEEA